MIAFLLALAASTQAGDDADWPHYMHDVQRSGVTQHALPERLEPAWTHVFDRTPVPAWPGPARWDGYNKIHDLEDRMIFDVVNQPVADRHAVYVGSVAEDRVLALDWKDGSRRWVHYTEGPVRLAPSVVGEQITFGSDDGCIYTVRARDGELVWKRRVAPLDRRVMGNGRLISLWPVRSSVVDASGLRIAAAGVFPWHGVHLTAFDPTTGELVWRTTVTDLPSQGYLLASKTKLYVPTARAKPVVFGLEDGQLLYKIEGGAGGTYALLVGDSLVYGPGKTGELSLSDDDEPDQLASFRGTHMIVHQGIAYLHTKTRLSALDRERYLELGREMRTLRTERAAVAKTLKELPEEDVEARSAAQQAIQELGTKIDARGRQQRTCILWDVPCDAPFALILAGEDLFAGGRDAVWRMARADGALRAKLPAVGRVYGLAAANDHLLASTDAGHLIAYRAPEER